MRQELGIIEVTENFDFDKIYYRFNQPGEFHAPHQYRDGLNCWDGKPSKGSWAKVGLHFLAIDGIGIYRHLLEKPCIIRPLKIPVGARVWSYHGFDEFFTDQMFLLPSITKEDFFTRMPQQKSPTK